MATPVVTLGLFLAISNGALASLNLQPSWSTVSPTDLGPNASFLADHLRIEEDDDVLSALIDSDGAAGMRRQYERTVGELEYRRQAGLSDWMTDTLYVEKVKEFRKEALNKVRDTQRKAGLSRVRGAVNRDENLAKPVPVAMIAAVAAAYSNTPIDVAIAEGTTVTAKANIPEKTSELTLITPILNSGFKYQPAADEHYVFSVGRSLPVLNLNTGLTYAGTSSVLSAQVSKHLTNHLSCELGSSYSLLTDAAQDQSLRFKYEIRF